MVGEENLLICLNVIETFAKARKTWITDSRSFYRVLKRFVLKF